MSAHKAKASSSQSRNRSGRMSVNSIPLSLQDSTPRSLSLQDSTPRSLSLQDSTPQSLGFQTSTPRFLSHRPRHSISSLPRPVTQRGLAADTTRTAGTPSTPRSLNYTLSRTSSQSTRDLNSWSHVGTSGSIRRRDHLRSPEAREEKPIEARISAPTPESVRELTYDGSAVSSYLHDLALPHDDELEVESRSKSNHHSEDEFTGARAELDILDSPFNNSVESTNERPYTEFLGVPEGVDRSSLAVPSIVTDAGDQQQKQLQKRSGALDASIHSDFDLEESLASLPAIHEHELQEKILAARHQTRNNEGHLRRFIPKEELCRVVNAESVARELKKKLREFHSPETIKAYANNICRETEITRKNRKLIRSYRKIFALLVLVDATSSILLFLEEEVSDLELPMTLVKIEGTSDLCRKGDVEKRPLKCFRHEMWSPYKLENFQDSQWWMLAPFFARDDDGAVKHYVLRDEHILPFLPLTLPGDLTNHVIHKVGGYGKVFMVRIHSEHRDFQETTLCERGFAVKQQLYDEHREAYKKEIAILKKFTGAQSHKHVVSLLASYEQFNKFNLIFYRAEGDLSEFWKEIQKTPHITRNNVLWMAEQCEGLSDALFKLHRHLSFPKRQNITVEHQKHPLVVTADQYQKQTNGRVTFMVHSDSWGNDGIKERPPSPVSPPQKSHVAVGSLRMALRRAHSDEVAKPRPYGRHGDINPVNILWYDDEHGDENALRGTLKITDFGQAELNSSKSKTKRQSVAMTLTYRPPECDLQPRFIRQSYDIWCLGCVFLEFVTWMLGGSELLQKFILRRWVRERLLPNNPRSDIFFKLVRHKDSDPLEAIIKPEVTAFINELHAHSNCTEYFHDFLVMIQNDMLVVEPSERKSCAGICAKLKAMLDRCRRDEDYVTATNPWCLTKEPERHTISDGKTNERPVRRRASRIPRRRGRAQPS